MNFEIIETKRLLLKVLSANEMNFIFENYPKPEIKKILGHYSEDEYQKEENKHKNGYSSYNRSFKLFLMIDKTTNLIVGRCGLHNWNEEHKRAEVGYAMTNESYKRKGLMTEVLETVIEYGFTKMNLHRIEALVGTENVPSLKLIKKNGFVKEGLLRQHYFLNDKYVDSAVFSKLYSEFINKK